MKKFKKAKIITALCSALTIIGTTLFLASCSDNAIQQQTNSKVSEQQPLTKIELHDAIQNIINEVIQEDNGSYQNEEEKNEVNKKVEEIAKEIFDANVMPFLPTDRKYTIKATPLILETQRNITRIPGFLDTAIESGYEVANEKFKTAILDESKKLFQNDEYRELMINGHKFGILNSLDEKIPNEKVRTKVKKIVTKVFENETFKTALLESSLSVRDFVYLLANLLANLLA